MKPIELAKLIKARFLASIKRPVHIEGSPGIGKTQIPGQVATELSAELKETIGFKVVHAPLLQPEDYGMPVTSMDRKDVDFVVSKEKFPLVGSDCPDRGLFLIDELPQADTNAQKILRNLIQEREIHGKRIKPNWMILSTGNRTIDRAGANRLLSHLSNVLTRIELEVSIDDWTNWALKNGVKPEVIAFIRFKSALINNFDPQQEINATPRAWVEGVSASLGVVDPSLEFQVFKGDVGEGPAVEFLSFLKVCRKLVSVDTIILNPTGTPVPTETNILYALSGSLAHRVTKDNFGRIMQYVNRIPGEFGLLFIRDAIKMHPEIQESMDYIQWVSGPIGSKLLT